MVHLRGGGGPPRGFLAPRSVSAVNVSVVIRARDEAQAIGQVLEKVRDQQADTHVEVIVVDSGSRDRTVEIARTYDTRLLVIPQTRFTFGYALNYGIAHAAGEIICCLSAHCVPCSTSWLSELVRPIGEESAQATFGRQVPVKGVNPFEEVSLQRHFPEAGGAATRLAFSNANCAFLKALWREQPFDEEIPGWEDYLWYLMLKDRHVFAYVPSAAVLHSHPFSWRRFAHTASRDGKALRYMRRAYRFDAIGERGSAAGRLGYVFRDVADHAVCCLRAGYRGYAVLAPFVKLCYYAFFARGYLLAA